MTDKDKIKKLKARVRKLENALVFSDEIVSILSEMLEDGYHDEGMTALEYITLAAIIAKGVKNSKETDK